MFITFHIRGLMRVRFYLSCRQLRVAGMQACLYGIRSPHATDTTRATGTGENAVCRTSAEIFGSFPVLCYDAQLSSASDAFALEEAVECDNLRDRRTSL